MSIHKLTAGSGYDYLTRQVAALDATEKGHVPLASYYTERGETPGVWIGSGLAGIDGLQAGDPVTAEQMQALFGVGLHPLAVQRQQQLQGPDPDQPGLPTCYPVGCDVQDLPQRHSAVSSRSSQAHRRPQYGRRPAPRLADPKQRTCQGPHRGSQRVVCRRAPQATAGCAGTRRDDRQTLPPPNDCGRRLRPDLLASQERLDAVSARRTRCCSANRKGPPRRRVRRAGLHRTARPVQPNRCQRRPAGQRPRTRSDRIHPPRQPRRRLHRRSVRDGRPRRAWSSPSTWRSGCRPPHCDVSAFPRQANPASRMPRPPRNSVSASTVAAFRAVSDMYGNSSVGSAAMTAVPCPASGPR
jgi:TrwC relaxase